jgi:hypothetical protein
VKLRLVLLFGLLATGAFAAGTGDYQRTKDGKTLVWNSAPKPGEEATWFGDRDNEGYATGAGTLTWYTAKGHVYARYFGKMVHGKFNGPVNAHARGKTAHAIFADGELSNRWVAGPAHSRPEPETAPMVAEAKPKPQPQPSPKAEAAPPKIASQTQAPVTPLTTPSPASVQRIESPAEGPPVAKAPSKDKQKAPFDSSLTALIGPPSSLHTVPQNTQLTQDDAIGLADAEARTQGYDLSGFERPKSDYSAATGKWTLYYEQKSADGSLQAGKHFIATVEDQTRKTTVERKPDFSE